MKETYYVDRNAQSNGDHEVHVDGCRYMPASKVELGEFFRCGDAIKEARLHYKQVNGCYFCCEPCHTR